MDGTVITTDLEAAERIVRRVAEELTAELRRKLPKNKSVYVAFWIGGGSVVAFPHEVSSFLVDSTRGVSVAAAAEQMRAIIAKLPDPDEQARAGWLAIGVDPDTLREAA